MSRSPLPSRWTLDEEFVIVSISPVPKLEPGPVSYIQLDDGPLPEDPLKSSLNWVDHPDGGAGTVSGRIVCAVCRAATAALNGLRGARGPRLGCRVRAGRPEITDAEAGDPAIGAQIPSATTPSPASTRRPLRDQATANRAPARPSCRFRITVGPPNYKESFLIV